MSPKSQNLYKITEILKDGFGLKLQNLRTASVQSVTHEKVKLLSLQELVAANITEKNFYNTPQLLSKRGYFQRGKSKLRLNLLPDQNDYLEKGLEDDWEEPRLRLAQPENPANSEISKPPNQAAISPEQAAINEEDDLLRQYSQEDEYLSDGLDTQDGENEDQPQFCRM